VLEIKSSLADKIGNNYLQHVVVPLHPIFLGCQIEDQYGDSYTADVPLELRIATLSKDRDNIFFKTECYQVTLQNITDPKNPKLSYFRSS